MADVKCINGGVPLVPPRPPVAVSKVTKPAKSPAKNKAKKPTFDVGSALHLVISAIKEHNVKVPIDSKLLGWYESRYMDLDGALCDVLDSLDNTVDNISNYVDAPILEWWKVHTDKERSKLREQALKKLTKRERKALGF